MRQIKIKHCCNSRFVSIEVGTYHIWVKGRGDLLSIEVIPVDGGEKHVIFDFSLRKHKLGTVKRRLQHQQACRRVHSTNTYKVLCAAQPLGPVLLQQALQQMPRRVGNVGFQLQRLVQDVVVHLRCVPAVEWRLGRDKKGN